MIPVNASSFGRFTGAVRRYPGGTENAIILATLSREMLKCRAACRRLMPSAQASRTFRYKSTVKILPPSLPPERAKVADFYAARSRLIPPLPWPTFPPPFSVPAVLDPLSAAEGRVPDRRVLYATEARPIRKRHVKAAEALKGGVRAIRFDNPKLHGKFLLWDADDIVVTSMNWGSKQGDPLKPFDEVGLHIHAPGASDMLHQVLVDNLGDIHPE